MAGEDAVSYIFGGNTGLTYEQLKRRRAVALALASQRRGYPKTVGEGMTYLGESIGDMLAERRLDAAEKGYLAKQSATLAGLMPGAPPAAPVSAPARPGAAPTPIIPPAAPRPPSAPVRPPAAPIPPRPQPSQGYGGQAAPAAPPASAVGPAPSISPQRFGPPAGELTQGYVQFDTPSGEGMTSGPPPSEFAMGGILNAAPMAAPNLEPAFPGETGGTGQAGLVPSSGYLPPTATAAAPPSTPPAPQATAPPAPVSAMDYASWPHGPIRRPTDTAVEESTAGPVTAPAAPAEPAPRAQSVAPGYTAPRSEVENYIRQAAAARGIDPDIAIRVARSEGIANYRSTASRGGVREPSYGPYQLLVGGPGTGYPRGLGNEAPFDPTDPNTWRENVDFALDRARQGGWGPWYGARRVGITGRAGIGEAPIEDGGGNIRLAAYAPDGGAGAPIPGMGGAGSPRLQPQIPPLQGPPPAPESEQITPTDIMPMPSTAQFGGRERFVRTDAPVPGVAAPTPSQAPAVAPPPPQEPPGGIPGPLAQPTPVTPAPSLGRQTVPEPPGFRQQLVRPTPPTYPEQPSEYEIRAQRAIAANPGDTAIHEQAKALADFGKAQRDAKYLREVEEYKKDLELYNTLAPQREKFILDTPKREAEQRKLEEELAAKAREEERSRRLGGVDPAVLTKQIEESQKNVKNIPAATLAIANAKQVLLDQNMFTGSSAEMNLSMAKLLKAAGFPGDPRIEATEQFKAYISPIVAQARQAMAGGTNISDRDMMAAERAAAGDIKLERGSIKGVLDSVERINTAMAVDHQKKLLAFTGNDPDAQRVIFGTFGLPMENIVPPAAVQRLRDNASNPQAIREFDDAFKTPGLAQRVLGRR